MDRTSEFRAGIRVARSLTERRNKNGIKKAGAADSDDAGGRFSSHRTHRTLPRAAGPEERLLSAFSRQCAGIRTSISGLRAFLLEGRVRYVGAGEAVSSSSSASTAAAAATTTTTMMISSTAVLTMTDAERGALDDELARYVGDCRSAIDGLPVTADEKRAKEEKREEEEEEEEEERVGGGDGEPACYARHRIALVESLRAYLQRVVDLHTAMRRARTEHDRVVSLATDYTFDVVGQDSSEEEGEAEEIDEGIEEGGGDGRVREGRSGRGGGGGGGGGGVMINALAAALPGGGGHDGLRKRRNGGGKQGAASTAARRQRQQQSSSTDTYQHSYPSITSAFDASLPEDAAAAAATTAVISTATSTTTTSPELATLLRQENAQVMERMDTFAEEVLKAESMVVTLSKLQNVLTTNLVKQAEDIDTIYDNTVDAADNVDRGNKELSTARKHGNDFRWAVVFFFLMLSFSLLFLDWYSS
eukprot:UC1_evm1s1280